ncbi:MAG: alpha/beta hydrolase [Ardenticatenaceae bacterium]|nr:alpha/beta hydrolase [Ardenticatenaceae bacterium]
MKKTNSNDGTPIAFWESGSGPPLLLVHGTTADHTRWSAISPRFEQHFTVYAMDRRGRGQSGDSPDYNFLREAEDVAAVVDAIGESVFVLGHSYGALCTLEAALLTKGISRLILYEPPLPTGTPLFPRDLPGQMQSLLDKGQQEEALVLFLRNGPKMPDHELKAYRQLPVWPTRVSLAPTIPREIQIDSTYKFDAEKFAGLEVQTLLLLGGDSPNFFHEGIRLLDSALPNSRITVLPGQQHIAMDTNPDLFAAETLQFLLA